MKKIGNTLVTSALLLAAVSFAQGQGLQPGSAHFTIHQGEQPVGTCSFEIHQDSQGYRIRSHGNVKMQDLSYAFSKTEHLDPAMEIADETLSGTVNGSAVTFAVHPDGNKFAIDISADGQSYKNSLDRHPQTIFFPDFDPSSYEVLQHFIEQQASGVQAWALIPKQTGLLMNVKLEDKGTLQGTLNGTSLKVHHRTLTIGSVSSDVYGDNQGELMEVDIPSQGFVMVRDQFQLQPPPKPDQAPPPQQDQPSNPQ